MALERANKDTTADWEPDIIPVPERDEAELVSWGSLVWLWHEVDLKAVYWNNCTGYALEPVLASTEL